MARMPGERELLEVLVGAAEVGVVRLEHVDLGAVPRTRPRSRRRRSRRSRSRDPRRRRRRRRPVRSVPGRVLALDEADQVGGEASRRASGRDVLPNGTGCRLSYGRPGPGAGIPQQRRVEVLVAALGHGARRAAERRCVGSESSTAAVDSLRASGRSRSRPRARAALDVFAEQRRGGLQLRVEHRVAVRARRSNLPGRCPGARRPAVSCRAGRRRELRHDRQQHAGLPRRRARARTSRQRRSRTSRRRRRRRTR